jgi:hypothetical protein
MSIVTFLYQYILMSSEDLHHHFSCAQGSLPDLMQTPYNMENDFLQCLLQ